MRPGSVAGATCAPCSCRTIGYGRDGSDGVLRNGAYRLDIQIPDYLVLLATLGGLAVFGISGFVIGPVIAAFFFVVWEMFAEEHAERTVIHSDRPTADVPEESSAA